MMIIKLNDYSRLEEVARFAYELNKNNETKCKSMSDDYDCIYDGYKRRIDNSDDVLIYVDDNEIKGVCAFSPEHSIKYVQTTGGIFAPTDFEFIGNQFYEYLIDNYKGYEFYSSYASENIEAKDFWFKRGAVLDSDTVIYEMDMTSYNYKETIAELLGEDDLEKFKKMLNDFVPDAYWKGDMMVQDGKLMGGFRVLVIKEGNEITDYIATRVGEKFAETYFIYSRNNDVGVIKQLLTGALNDAKDVCKGNLAYFVEKKETISIEALELVGFTKSGTSSSYYIKSL